MNCKQGDLAIVVRVFSDVNKWMVGRVVTCESLKIINGHTGWLVMDKISSPPTHMFDYGWVADRCLRPIRDTPGEDETLKWLVVPTTEKTNA